MNQNPMDPMDLPEEEENISQEDMPAEILRTLMSLYEENTRNIAAYLGTTADAALPNANMGLVALISSHKPTLEYLVARGMQTYLENQMVREQKQIRDRVEGTILLSTMMREAAREAGAE